MRQPASGTAGDHYFPADSLGSIQVVTDSQGQAVTRYRYQPYGERTKTQGGSAAPASPFALAGQILDPQTGLYKMGMRYFDPEHRRWTQKDPLNLFQDPRQANRYAYAGGDPVNRMDPSGEDACDVVGDVGSFISPFGDWEPCDTAEGVGEIGAKCATGAAGSFVLFGGAKFAGSKLARTAATRALYATASLTPTGRGIMAISGCIGGVAGL